MYYGAHGDRARIRNRGQEKIIGNIDLVKSLLGMPTYVQCVVYIKMYSRCMQVTGTGKLRVRPKTQIKKMTETAMKINIYVPKP